VTLEQAAKRVRSKMLVIVSPEDHMVNPSPAVEFCGGDWCAGCESGLGLRPPEPFVHLGGTYRGAIPCQSSFRKKPDTQGPVDPLSLQGEKALCAGGCVSGVLEEHVYCDD